MPKYEIMLILDPKADIKIANNIANEVFGTGIVKFNKMDRTDLAYKINNSSTATYILIDVETDPKNIAEFNRRVNITKNIWRSLAINLDAEKANKIAKPRTERRFFPKRDTRPKFKEDGQ